MHAAAVNVAMGLVVQHSELSKDFATLKQFEADSHFVNFSKRLSY